MLKQHGWNLFSVLLFACLLTACNDDNNSESQSDQTSKTPVIRCAP